MFSSALRLAHPPRLCRLAKPRCYSVALKSYFQLFPKTFPHGGPPQDSFLVDPKGLRREYRALQSQHHPDVAGAALAASENSDDSSIINRAYSTLRNPYTRAAYLIKLLHPEQLDITEDDMSKHVIALFQQTSPQNSLNYKTLLMAVLDAHEALEMVSSQEDMDALNAENKARMRETELGLNALISQDPVPWDDFIIEAIKMKYWVNIENGIKEGEPGRPVFLTH